jgi:F5/8 type C domain-containing protein
MSPGRAAAAAVVLVALLGAGPEAPEPARHVHPIDDFEDLSPWSVHPADGVDASIASDAGAHGKAMRVDVRFRRGTGYAVVRRRLDLDLPSDYAFRFAVRGELPVNTLEFKLVDSSGANVWWHVRRDLAIPRQWTTLTTRRRQVQFAWGPSGGGEIRHMGFLEFAITAGEGGAGSVWLDDLELEPLLPDSTAPRPRATASSARPGMASENALDGNPATAWANAPGDSSPSLTLDLGRTREVGGLVIDWEPGAPPAYRVAASIDGAAWTVVRTVPRSNGGADPLYLPGCEARYLRLGAARGMAVREITVEPYEWSQTPEAFFTHLAAAAPRGSWPRPYCGEQCPWAVVGADGGREEALLSLDGALETGKRRFSIEPFIELDGRFISWADVTTETGLEDDRLPIPSVRWRMPGASLTITAFAHPDTATPDVFARYRVRNESNKARHVTLYLAARPFQVNPPWQQVGAAGGVAPLRRIARDGNAVSVDGAPGFFAITPPTGFGATSFDAGEIAEHLREGRLPAEASVVDSSGFASAAFAWALDLPARGEREVRIAIPLRRGPAAVSDERAAAVDTRGGWGRPPADLEDLERRSAAYWRARLDRVRFTAPDSAREALRTLEAQIGWILVNRDGASIQPGSRSYDRSWIRDGSLTSLALLRLGHAEVVRDFIAWFAAFQGADGRIPCCASARGPDPVPENDSHGEFLDLIAEYHRYTGDAALVRRQWPRIAGAVAYLDTMRAQRRGAEWRTPERREFFGLVLPSISHEGYANPMHSYWDNFFAYRGYVAAVYLAGVAGENDARRRFAAARDTFAHDLAASVAAAMEKRSIDYIPGCAELGDLDATSTTIALSPTGAADLLADAAVRRTFDRYWDFFTARRDGREAWDGFTPYETRVIGTFVRLGMRARANDALNYFLAHRLTAGWRQWPEVVYRDPRAPKYLGDLPHTWVGSDYVRSVLDMIAYDRDRDSTLVLGAGLPTAWIEGDGLRVDRLRTPYGQLGARFVARPAEVEVTIAPGLRVPAGGIVVLPPSRAPFQSVQIDGKAAAITPEGAAIVRRVPSRVVFR